jgi:hypothetical protein
MQYKSLMELLHLDVEADSLNVSVNKGKSQVSDDIALLVATRIRSTMHYDKGSDLDQVREALSHVAKARAEMQKLEEQLKEIASELKRGSAKRASNDFWLGRKKKEDANAPK